jgi:hypothetical protein
VLAKPPIVVGAESSVSSQTLKLHKGSPRWKTLLSDGPVCRNRVGVAHRRWRGNMIVRTPVIPYSRIPAREKFW